MADDRTCTTCGHPFTFNRCWRMTCPTNGAGESFHHVRSAVETESREQAERIKTGHPSTWGEPPQTEFML